MESTFKNKLVMLTLSLGIFLGSSASLSAATNSTDTFGLAIGQGAVATKEYVKSALIGKAVGATAAYLTTNGVVRFFLPELNFQQIALSAACFCTLKTAYHYSKNYWDDKFKNFEKPEQSCHTALCLTANILPSLLNPETLCATAILAAFSLFCS